ncbi:MAG: cytochrome c [Thermoanaerobaculia bacterium]|nr:cytochrome c [Thermoanaerobaculia bacterium]
MRHRSILVALCTVVAAAGLVVPVAAQGPPVSVWDGIYTEEQAARGEPLYHASCAECHGSELEGGEMGAPLAGSDFMWAWNELTVGDLFERLRVSMPEANPKSMTNQEKVDVLAYMLARNDIPAGAEELEPSTAKLKPILFQAVRP